jgi:hypothetical protein
MWFMHDGAPPHFSITAREFSENMYPAWRIGRGGPTAWPPRSPDLNPVHFHIWGHLKTLAYATPVNDIATLRQRVEGGCQAIRKTPGTAKRVRQSVTRRAQCCVKEHGGHLVHLLYNIGKEKSALIRKGGFSGPMLIRPFFHSCV